MVNNKRQGRRWKSVLEVLSIVGPIICLVDCIVIPLVLVLLPFIGVQKICHGVCDQLLAFVALLICAPVLIPGFLRHRRKVVLACMAAGFALIFLANFAGAHIDNTIHSAILAAGCLLLIKANWDNRRFNKCSCNHGHEHAMTETAEEHSPVAAQGMLN